MVEFFGYLGFDWFFLDLEHYPIDLETLADVVRASEVAGIVPIAKVPSQADPELILRYLETGLLGVMVAFTRCREDVERVVRAVKYPPFGTRSAGAHRPARWGIGLSAADYYEASNRETMVLALIEDKVGVDNLGEILTVEGLDGIDIGPGDLALTLGHPGEYDHPEVAELRDRAHEQVLASDKALVITVSDGTAAHHWAQKGALLVRCRAQILLASACQNWLQAARGSERL